MCSNVAAVAGLAVSMHLLVLSALRHVPGTYEPQLLVSQCTFWCSALSDTVKAACTTIKVPVSMHLLALSAFRPAAQLGRAARRGVSMHLLVLSAFRPEFGITPETHPSWSLNAPSGAQCFPTGGFAKCLSSSFQVSMHLLVLSAFRRTMPNPAVANVFLSQCTFWCSVLSDHDRHSTQGNGRCVSMHLLVLSAFRLGCYVMDVNVLMCLNAPSGAQCFPTVETPGQVWALIRSQCTFWCSVLSDKMDEIFTILVRVSMHLLVLSAFRRDVC